MRVRVRVHAAMNPIRIVTFATPSRVQSFLLGCMRIAPYQKPPVPIDLDDSIISVQPGAVERARAREIEKERVRENENAERERERVCQRFGTGKVVLLLARERENEAGGEGEREREREREREKFIDNQIGD